MSTPKAQVYRLTKGRSPLSYTISNKDRKSKPLLWFDQKANGGRGAQRALRYAPNQRSIFEQEQDKEYRLEEIVFVDGVLTVTHREPLLREFLEHHPDNAANNGGVFELQDHAAEAQASLDALEAEDDARDMAKKLSDEELKNIIRKIMPNTVDQMEASEIKLEARLFAKRDPQRFLSYIEKVDLELDSMIAEAISFNLITWDHHKTAMMFSMEDNSKRMFKVPEGADPHEYAAEFLKTDEGMKAIVLLEEQLELAKRG